ncbi:MAG: tryptophan-rich sensory protein [Gammaproteobacteria bacterium]|nr:tryptophan-rich sensory protein [Gammaproteobacteria bacterium]
MDRKISDWGGNIVALVLVIVVNGLANVLRFGGQTTGEVSDKYYSMFTPAGFTFAIWSLIYLLLALFTVYQSLPAQRSNEQLARISLWFKAGCGANVLWMFAWHLEWIGVSLVLMIVLIVSLVRIYRVLDIVDPAAPAGQRWLVQLPFSVYLGWISVATIANISAMQSALGWNYAVLEEVSWTLLKLAVAGSLGAIVTLRRHDVAYGLVIGWAAFGIGAGQAATPAVAGAAFTLSLVILAIAAFEALNRVTAR